MSLLLSHRVRVAEAFVPPESRTTRQCWIVNRLIEEIVTEIETADDRLQFPDVDIGPVAVVFDGDGTFHPVDIRVENNTLAPFAPVAVDVESLVVVFEASDDLSIRVGLRHPDCCRSERS